MHIVDLPIFWPFLLEAVFSVVLLLLLFCLLDFVALVGSIFIEAL
jgi:hypothetical protein